MNLLPSTLAGPVAVCITSGGNDMKAQILKIATGTDGPERAKMGQNMRRYFYQLISGETLP